MKYYEVTFTLTASSDLLQTARELLASDLGEIGFETFEDTPQGITAYIQQPLLHEDELDDTVANFLLPDVEIAFSVAAADDKNWNEAWEAIGFEPIDIPGGLLVVDAKHTDLASIDAHGRLVIGIEARQAFGTGTHETTRMVLATLHELPLASARMLDCGCGTGILSIAALKLGAREAVGYDIDEWSTANAAHNAELNHVAAASYLLGDSSVLTSELGLFNVVVANIFREILLADMPRFVARMAPDAHLVLSGFYADDAPLLIARAEELGLTHVATRNDNNWTCLLLQKKGCAREPHIASPSIINNN